MKSQDRQRLSSIARLANCNPFSPERFAIEKELLGSNFVAEDSVTWNRRLQEQPGDRENVVRITELASNVVSRIDSVPSKLRNDYWDASTYLLLYRHLTPLPIDELSPATKKSAVLARAWKGFWNDYNQLFSTRDQYVVDESSAAHLFAFLAQVRRAFSHIYSHILGDSLPIARLREQVWESIFSCDLRRYHNGLYSRMRDLSTLVTGPSGTGKELVARAIGLSQYIPFDPESCRFQAEPGAAFFPLNLSALSPTLIESELFGHRRGAFTGAVEDRMGWLEACGSHGAVFLDEIGELELGLQVKLLRVVQQRTYCRLGETKERRFVGKIITATNRDLLHEIDVGAFREDFYFRLCSDRIETPSLREQLDDRPEDLRWLSLSIAQNLTGLADAEAFADEAVAWMSENLGDDYPWKGNIRELEQCISSYLIRRSYTPNVRVRDTGMTTTLPPCFQALVDGTSTADEVLRRYCTWVYAQQGTYEKASRVLKLDRRTVKSKVDESLLE